MFLFTFWCLSFCALSAANDVNMSVFLAEHAVDEQVSYCVRDIINDIVVHDKFIIDVILMNIGNVVDLSKLHGIKKARFINRSFYWVHNNLFHRIYVISCVNFEEFTIGIKKAMNDFYFNAFANFIIVMDNFGYNHHYQMTTFLVSNNIYNVTILAQDVAGDGYKIYTFYSQIYPCNQTNTLACVSNCSIYDGEQNIFPKMKSIRGCSYQLLTHNVFPFINLDDENEEGIEQRIIRYFQQYAQIKIQLIPFTKLDKLGQIVGNYTYIDTLEKVSNNEFEGAVGGYFLYNNKGIEKLSFTYPLYIDYMSVIMHRSTFMDTWQALFQKARSTVILTFILFVIFSISAYTLCLFPALQNDLFRDILIIYGYFLNNIITRKFKPGIPETLIASCLLFSVLIIPYTMQAYMCSIKTHPVRGYEPKEYDEVVQCCQLVVTSIWLKKGIAEHQMNCESRLKCLQLVRDKIKGKPHYTLIASQLYEAYKWMLADTQCNLSLYTLKEPVLILLRTMFYRRGSVLVQPSDKFFLKMMSGGLAQKHFGEILFTERLKCKPTNITESFVPLKLHDLKVPYMLFVGGLFVSALTFAYEVITRRALTNN